MASDDMHGKQLLVVKGLASARGGAMLLQPWAHSPAIAQGPVAGPHRLYQDVLHHIRPV